MLGGGRMPASGTDRFIRGLRRIALSFAAIAIIVGVGNGIQAAVDWRNPATVACDRTGGREKVTAQMLPRQIEALAQRCHRDGLTAVAGRSAEEDIKLSIAIAVASHEANDAARWQMPLVGAAIAVIIMLFVEWIGWVLRGFSSRD